MIVHEATALANLGKNSRNSVKAFAGTNQLRTVGTKNLLAAASDVGVAAASEPATTIVHNNVIIFIVRSG